QFASGAATNATFFVNDRYDYPVATQFIRTQGSNLVPVLVYLNGHFTRTRGFEVEVEKLRAGGYWSGRISYTYQQTRGKSSDPNEERALQEIGGSSETRLSEEFVRWNRPSKLTGSFDVRWDEKAPEHWGILRRTGLNLYLQAEAG